MFTIDEAAYLLDATPETVQDGIDKGVLTLDKDTVLRASQVTNPGIWEK